MANIQILVGAGFTEVHGDPKNIEISETGSSIPKRNTLLSNSIIPRHKFLTYPATPLFLLA